MFQFLQSRQPTFSRYLLTEYLNALSTRPAAALLATPTLHFITNTPSLSIDSLIADLLAAEATYSGYAPLALGSLLGPVNINPSILAMSGIGAILATSASPFVGNTVTGYVIDDGAATHWYMAELFSAPVPVSAPGDGISLEGLFGADGNPIYS